MKRLTLVLVTAILAVSAAPSAAEPITKIVTIVKQVWVMAQYWNCALTIKGDTWTIDKCFFVYNRYVWVPEAARCGFRNVGTPTNPYPITVCWLHHRRIVGPPPLPSLVSGPNTAR